MNSVVVHLALALFGTVGSCILIWRLADPDPKHLRAALGPQELLAAERRVAVVSLVGRPGRDAEP